MNLLLIRRFNDAVYLRCIQSTSSYLYVTERSPNTVYAHI